MLDHCAILFSYWLDRIQHQSNKNKKSFLGIKYDDEMINNNLKNILKDLSIKMGEE